MSVGLLQRGEDLVLREANILCHCCMSIVIIIMAITTICLMQRGEDLVLYEAKYYAVTVCK